LCPSDRESYNTSLFITVTITAATTIITTFDSRYSLLVEIDQWKLKQQTLFDAVQLSEPPLDYHHVVKTK
jgi:hypothetical protein